MLRVNEEVRLTNPIVLEPYARLEKGERGTVVDVQEDRGAVYEATVRMRRYHPGLTQWHNEALLAADELPNLKVLSRPVQWLKKCAAALLITLALGGVADVALAQWHHLEASCSTILGLGSG